MAKEKPKPDNPLYGKFDQVVETLVTPKPQKTPRPCVIYQSAGPKGKQ